MGGATNTPRFATLCDLDSPGVSGVAYESLRLVRSVAQSNVETIIDPTRPSKVLPIARREARKLKRANEVQNLFQAVAKSRSSDKRVPGMYKRVYLRTRQFDPATAQFTSRDPLGPITREPYTYAENNPPNVGDPTGLIAIGEIPVIGGGA